MVKNVDGSMRFCVDYRKLNLLTKKDSFPLSRIDSCLDSLGGSTFFSTLDLRQRYFQVPMATEDIEKHYAKGDLLIQGDEFWVM
jgi:hypothetical protein